MAIEKIIKIDVDQVKAMGGLTAFQQSLEKTEEKSQSLKAELAQLKRELATLDEGTEQYQTIAKRAGEVSDKIGDINTKIKNLGSDTKNIDAVVQGAQTLSGAFTVATSATQLFGIENEDLQKSMAKVEAAIGLTVGIQSIANALQKESALYIGLSNLATKIQIGLQVAYAAVVGTTTGALKALKVALVSTGVGALVVILGYLISKMGESSDATEEMSKKQKELNKELEYTKELTDAEIKSIDSRTQLSLAYAKKRGATDKELTKIQIDGINARINANQDEINKIKSSQEQEYNLTKEQNKRIQDLRNQNLDLYRQGNIQVANFEADQAQKSRDLEKKNAEDAKKKAEERQKLLEEQAKKRLDLLDDELTEMIAFDERLKENEDKKYQIRVDALDAELTAILDFDERVKANDEKKKAEELERDKKLAEEKRNIRNSEIEAAQGVFTILAGLGEKNKGLQKAALVAQSALSIASIIVNTNVGSSKEVATKGIFGLSTSAILYAKMGISIASVLAATAKGLSALGGGGGGSAPSSGGSDGGSASTPPSFNIVGQNSNNQLAQTIAQQQQQPLQAYVVSGNITSAQVLDRNRIDTATFN